MDVPGEFKESFLRKSSHVLCCSGCANLPQQHKSSQDFFLVLLQNTKQLQEQYVVFSMLNFWGEKHVPESCTLYQAISIAFVYLLIRSEQKWARQWHTIDHSFIIEVPAENGQILSSCKKPSVSRVTDTPMCLMAFSNKFSTTWWRL